MSVNPYNFSNPVDSAKFFGRTQFLTSLLQTIQSGSKRVVIIYGGPRFGKTSTLQAVAGQLPADTHFPLLLTLNDKLSLPLTQTLQILANSLAQATGLPAPTLANESAAADFLQNFLPQVRQKVEPRRLVFLLDDVDHWLNVSAEAGNFLQRWIDLQPLAAFVLATATDFRALPPALVQTQQAELVRLPFLPPPETLNLITWLGQTAPLTFTDKAIEAITRLSAGHPFLAQLICHQMVEQTNAANRAEIDVAAINAALPAILAHSSPVFKPAVAGLSEVEQSTLVACAATAMQSKFLTPKAIGDSLRKQGLKTGEKELNQILERLQQRQLLEREMQGVFSFVVPLAVHWVLYNYGANAGSASPLVSKRNLFIGLGGAALAVIAAGILWLSLAPAQTATPTAPPAAAVADTPTSAPEPTPTPAEESTEPIATEPIIEPTPSPTATPTPEPTFTVTSTFTPTPAPTETPAATPTPTATRQATVVAASPTTPAEITALPTPNPAALPLPDGLQFFDVAAAAGGQVFAVAKDQGIYRRAPGGGWSLFSADLGDGVTVRAVGLRDSGGGNITLYAGYDNAVRQWRAETGWSGKISYPRFHEFAPIPNSSLVFAGSDKGIYRSLDDGRTWEAVNLGVKGRIIEVAIFSLALGRSSGGNYTLYAAGADSAVFFKTNINPAEEAAKPANEPRWEDVVCQCDTRSAIFAIATDPANAQTIYVGNDRSRISLSTDGGLTWATTVVPVGRAQEVFITDIEVAPGNSAAYAATGSDLAAYASNGLLVRVGPNEWSAVQPPKFIAGRDYAQSVAIDPANPAAAYVGGSNGLFKFDAGAQAWIPSP